MDYFRKWDGSPHGLDTIKDVLSRLQEEKDSVILSELSSENILYEWLNFQELDFPSRCNVLKLIAKACTCNDDRGMNYELIQRLVSLKASLITFLSVLLSKEQGQQNDYDRVQMLKLIFDVVHSIFRCLPVSSMDFIDIIIPQVQLILKKSSSELAKELILGIAELFEQRKSISPQESKSSFFSRKEGEVAPPPGDFRNMTLLPSKHEIESEGKPYLRANVTRGPYESVDHYLDVQFRLLREDMFRYLRESIAEYKSNEWSRGTSVLLQNGHLYFDAKVSSRKYKNGAIFVSDIYIGRTVDWNTTKLLLPNSLLCLSSDRFQTFIFACVCTRKPLDSNAFSCSLQFSVADKLEMEYIELGKSYDIIETTSFYETYKYVLERLQLFDARSFPLSTCILFLKDCNKQPDYWTETCIRLDTFEKSLIPSILTKFDEHQQTAFKMALSNQVSIIQGPPGTGKTYLGLEIVKWLVQNAWLHGISAPILVVCYTNHALDQFLEGALKFTRKVIRVGGQSKNPSLEPHNIHNIVNELIDEMKRRAGEKTRRFCDDELCRSCNKKRFGDNANHLEDEDYFGDHFCGEDSCEGSRAESLKIGLEILDNEIYLDRVGRYTKVVRETEKKLKNLEQRICELDIDHIYNEAIMLELLPENLWQEVLGCLDTFSGKKKSLTKFLVKGLESWLCLSASFLHAYEDLPELLLLIIKQFLGYVKDKNFNNTELIKRRASRFRNKTIVARENVFMSRLWNMCLKIENLTTSRFAEIIPADANNQVQFFLEEHVLNKKVVFGFVEKSASNYVEQNKCDLKLEHRQIWENGLIGRWAIFFKWKSSVKDKFRNQRTNLYREYLQYLKYREGVRIANNVRVAKKADILGLTTTGAAKHWEMLQQVSPFVVLAEEAAEVLEAHITTALNKDTKHLILIGDHKQLRPIPTVYELGKKFKLDISMFERLLTNGAPSHCLQTQHRMRPCIAELLVPEIYDNLENHPSVLKYENIKGIANNMYFVKHQVHEDSSTELRSHRNKYEADFIICLCRYLLQQGYRESDITILTTYVGQLKFLNEIMKKKLEVKVRATTVDNFQGEENDIILLSFVRSNWNNSLGFIEISNRICVALSRARNGLFCIGNFDSFAEKCHTWINIVKKLEKMKLISSALPLKCQNHSAEITLVSQASDFDKVIHGGCMKKCTYSLACGHICPLPCHLGMKRHAELTCSKMCQDKLEKTNSSIMLVTENISEDYFIEESTHVIEEKDDHGHKNEHGRPAKFSGEHCGTEIAPSRKKTSSVDSCLDREVEDDLAFNSPVSCSPSMTLFGKNICPDENRPSVVGVLDKHFDAGMSEADLNSMGDIPEGLGHELSHANSHSDQQNFVSIFPSYLPESNLSISSNCHSGSASVNIGASSENYSINFRKHDIHKEDYELRALTTEPEKVPALVGMSVLSETNSSDVMLNTEPDRSAGETNYAAPEHDTSSFSFTRKISYRVTDYEVQSTLSETVIDHEVQSAISETAPNFLAESALSETVTNHDVQSALSEIVVDREVQISLSQTVINHELEIEPLETVANYDVQSALSGTASNHEVQVALSETVVDYVVQSAQLETVADHDIQSAPLETVSDYEVQSAVSEIIIDHEVQCAQLETVTNCDVSTLSEVADYKVKNALPETVNNREFQRAVSETVTDCDIWRVLRETTDVATEGVLSEKTTCNEVQTVLLETNDSITLTTKLDPTSDKIDYIALEEAASCFSFINKGYNIEYLCADRAYRSERTENSLSDGSLSCAEPKHSDKHDDSFVIAKSDNVTDSPNLLPRDTTNVDGNNLKHGHNDQDLRKELTKYKSSNIQEPWYQECFEVEKNVKLLFSTKENKADTFDLGTCDHKMNRNQQCNVLILKILQCQHEIHVPCSKYHLQHECKEEVEVQLPCLHSLSVTCSDWKWLKEIRCTFRETLLTPCGKLIHFACSQEPSHAECTSVVLKCGHRVPCYTDVDNYKCEVPVKCILPCSHQVDVPCTIHYILQKVAAVGILCTSEKQGNHIPLLQRLCSKDCSYIMECGHRCSGKCGICIKNGKHAYCYEIVERDLPCFHKLKCECHIKDLFCTERCDFLMECGHRCTGKCGSCMDSRKHAKCCETVKRVLPCGHQLECECHIQDPNCTKICDYLMECGHRCLFRCDFCMEMGEHTNCHEIVIKDLPCGHQLEFECHIQDHPYCPNACNFLLECGHRCLGKCGSCTKNESHAECLEVVKKELPCGHHTECECHAKDPYCPNTCNFLMECGHRCLGKCGSCTKNEIHAQCREVVKKELPCGHLTECKCHAQDPYCPNICNFLMGCGHRCSGECGSCSKNGKHDDCCEIVKRDLFCGHNLECECHVKDPYCTISCATLLSCGHLCPGECGRCSEFQIHDMCLKLVNRNLPCGHCVEWTCGSPLPVCDRRCLFGCEHSQCINSCQYPCIKCSEPCEWKCEHCACSMRCGEHCNRPPCDVRCPLILACGHQCIGYCGEPCPNVCFLCNVGIVAVTEDDSNWYVLLENCQHAIPMKNLQRYFMEKSPSSCPSCPICGTVITRNRRFGSCIKSWLASNLHSYGQESYARKELVSTKLSVLHEFISEMFQSNIGTAFISNAIRMFRNVCILRDLQSRDPLDSWSLSKFFESLEGWLLVHGGICSEQQVEESSRAVRRLCSLCFLVNFSAPQHLLKAKLDSDISQVLTLLESKPFGERQEKEVMEILHQNRMKDEKKSGYSSDLLCLINDLNIVQKSETYTNIEFRKYFRRGSGFGNRRQRHVLSVFR